MSQENVEIVRACVPRRSARATSTASCRAVDPDVVVDWSDVAADSRHASTEATRTIRGVLASGFGGVRRLPRSSWRTSSRSSERRRGRRARRPASADGERRRSSALESPRSGHDSRRAEIVRVDALPDQQRSPRSRGAVGVGDVAGERGDRAAACRGVQRRGTWTRARQYCRPRDRVA